MASKSREGDQVQELVMIDAIQRLGLQYYFQDDINATLKMSRDIEECGGNLHDVALRFRLLRQAGYDVQADTLSKFKNKEGKFKQELEQDTKGLLSLFEASQLSIPGDDILEEAADFTWDLLKTTTLKSVEKSEIAMIRNTLNNPCHKSLPKLTAKNQLHNFDTLIKFLHYDYCFGMHQWLKDIKDLATIDINMAQITFKYETTKVSRWWKELRMAEELELARHQPVKWHMWSCVALPSPDKAEIRTELTKMISFIYLIDDIFDVYGEVEELTLFTEAVNRWEYANVEELLPTYMKMCLKALYDTIDEMSESIYIKHGWNPKDVLHKAWAELCNAFLVEARWFDSKHLPTTEEYLKNGIVSSGVYVVFASLFCLLDESKDSKCANLGNSHPDIVTFVGTLLRLWDDLGSAKVCTPRYHLPFDMLLIYI
ncbi:(3S 6E)-nerolidol synthase 1 [Bienertia sinuspersici]